jgi:hypothetical protein
MRRCFEILAPVSADKSIPVVGAPGYAADAACRVRMTHARRLIMSNEQASSLVMTSMTGGVEETGDARPVRVYIEWRRV